MFKFDIYYPKIPKITTIQCNFYSLIFKTIKYFLILLTFSYLLHNLENNTIV